MGDILTFIHKGGFMMYPLILCSIVLLATVIERFVAFRRASMDGDELLEELKTLYKSDDPSEAIQLCEKLNRPISRVLARGLKNVNRDHQALEMAMVQEADNEIPVLESNLMVLRTIVTISPLLGLLGTISGIMASFRSVSVNGLSSPGAVLSGVAEALISTATGITLAVIAVICYNYFTHLAHKFADDLEFYSTELVNFVTDRVN